MNTFYPAFQNELLKLAQGMPLAQASERAPKETTVAAPRKKLTQLSTIPQRTTQSQLTGVKHYPPITIQSRKSRTQSLPKSVTTGAQTETQKYLQTRFGLPKPSKTSMPPSGGPVPELEGATPPMPTRGTVKARQRVLSKRFKELPKALTTGPGKVKPEKYAPELPTGLSEKARKTLTSWYAGQGKLKDLQKQKELQSLAQQEKEEGSVKKLIKPYLKEEPRKISAKAKRMGAAGKAVLRSAREVLEKADYPRMLQEPKTKTVGEAIIEPSKQLGRYLTTSKKIRGSAQAAKETEEAAKRAREAAKVKSKVESSSSPIKQRLSSFWGLKPW